MMSKESYAALVSASESGLRELEETFRLAMTNDNLRTAIMEHSAHLILAYQMDELIRLPQEKGFLDDPVAMLRWQMAFFRANHDLQTISLIMSGDIDPAEMAAGATQSEPARAFGFGVRS